MEQTCISNRNLSQQKRHTTLLALVTIFLMAGSQLARAQAWAGADVVTSDSRASRPRMVARDRGWARESSANAGSDGFVARSNYATHANDAPRDQPAARDTHGARNNPAPQPETRSAGVAAPSLFDSFSQGNKDNCGAVAMTKLVFALYGEAPGAGAFSHQHQNDGSVGMQLADGSVAYVSAQELRQAAHESAMEAGRVDGSVDVANLVYAVMAVRLAGTHDGRGLAPAAFAHALKTLGAGGSDADEDALAPLLGFAFDDHSGDNGAKGIYLLSSPLHVAFAYQGRYDEHGEDGGASTRNFLGTYRDAENHIMFRDFLEGTRANGQPVLVRQCSEAKAGWTPTTAQWIPRSACSM